MKNNLYTEFAELCSKAAEAAALRKLTLSKRKGDAEYKKITFTLYGSNNGVMLAFEGSLDDGKVIRKNYPNSQIFELVEGYLENYSQGNLMTANAEAIVMTSKKGKVTLSGANKVITDIDKGETVALRQGTDSKKNYIFNGSEKWLYELGISTKEGKIHDKKQSKFRQINRFTELLSDVYDKLPDEGVINVCDLCCGKSYLSFAVYEYLTVHKNRKVKMLCIDRKKDVIDSCSDIAEKTGADGLYFVADDIGNDRIYKDVLENGKVHLTISLHACDIATDMVLRRAVEMSSDVILSTPCCHHELYGKIDSEKLSFITSHSMLAQKFNDVVTDGLRVKMLEIEGYSVETVELVDPEETPKNMLIRASRRKNSKNHSRERLIGEYNAIIDFLGISGSYYDIYKNQ